MLIPFKIGGYLRYKYSFGHNCEKYSISVIASNQEIVPGKSDKPNTWLLSPATNPYFAS